MCVELIHALRGTWYWLGILANGPRVASTEGDYSVSPASDKDMHATWSMLILTVGFDLPISGRHIILIQRARPAPSPKAGDSDRAMQSPKFASLSLPTRLAGVACMTEGQTRGRGERRDQTAEADPVSTHGLAPEIRSTAEMLKFSAHGASRESEASRNHLEGRC